jgi:hypothetical protein
LSKMRSGVAFPIPPPTAQTLDADGLSLKDAALAG